MAADVVLPRLGWNMEEGTLTGWRKNDGDTVAAGEVLFEVESDKAVQEVEALEGGVLRIPPDSPPPGSTVPVGTVIAYLVQPGEPMPASPRSAPTASVAEGAPAPAPQTGGSAPTVPAAARRPQEPSGRRHPAISPRAKRTASELGVEWIGLRGTGSSGRIVERDVRKAASAAAVVRSAGVTAGARASAAVTLTAEADATELVRLRNRFKSSGAPTIPSYTDLLVKVAAYALQEHPDLNARFEQGSIVPSPPVNISVAMEAERGMAAPVIHDAQAKTLMEIAREAADLVERARSGRLRPADVGGGTFRIINLGMYEIDAFTPIVNGPECAALGMGRISARQVVVDAEAGQVAIRQMVVLSLTFDHRLVDAVSAARFLRTIKQCVETPYLVLAGR